MPIQSFWASEDKVPISQTKVSIPAENGLSYTDGQRIIFTIPDEHEYFNPVNTQLELDLEIKLPSNATYPTRLQLDSELGGSVIIRDIMIYANSAEMPLLEEIQNCNIVGALRYDYDANDNIRKKRAITEGCGMYDPKQRSMFKNTQTLGNCIVNSPYFTGNTSGEELVYGSVNSTAGPKKLKLLLPLHQSGIFGSSVVFPNKQVGGLRVELMLENCSRCVRQINSVKLWNKGENCARFHSLDGQDAAGAQDWGATQADVATEFYVSRINNVVDVDHFGLCVGEAFSIKDLTTGLFITWKDTAAGGGGATTPYITKLDTMPVAAGQTYPLVRVTLSSGLAAGGVFPSVAITGEGTSVGKYAIYSTALNKTVGENVTGVNDYTPTFEVSNCNIILERVEMPPAYTSKMVSAMKSGGTINYDFLSFTNYRYSQLQNDRVANIRVPIMNTRCKGTLCIPVDASVYSARDIINCGNGEERVGQVPTKTYYIDREGSESQVLLADAVGQMSNYSERSGLVGIADGLSNYQFFYSGRLNPSRKVDTSKISNRTSISQQSLIELEKALSVSGIPPHSFSQFRNNFCIGRAVGLQSGVTDLSTTDYNLQLEYNETGNDPTKNKTWNIFISHLRRLMIRGDSVMLQV